MFALSHFIQQYRVMNIMFNVCFNFKIKVHLTLIVTTQHKLRESNQDKIYWKNKMKSLSLNQFDKNKNKKQTKLAEQFPFLFHRLKHDIILIHVFISVIMQEIQDFSLPEISTQMI